MCAKEYETKGKLIKINSNIYIIYKRSAIARCKYSM